VSRAVQVYCLGIAYPEGSWRIGWRPELWSNPEFLATLTRQQKKDLRKRDFHWPRERMFLSSSSAYARAWLLRSYGADVEVHASEPVLWRSRPDWSDDPYWGSGDTAAQWSPELVRVREEMAASEDEQLRDALRSGAWPQEDQMSAFDAGLAQAVSCDYLGLLQPGEHTVLTSPPQQLPGKSVFAAELADNASWLAAAKAAWSEFVARVTGAAEGSTDVQDGPAQDR
jgi:hypothetical protein